MQVRSVFVLLSALSATTATPISRRCGDSGAGAPTGPENGVTYVLPSTGGPTPLPSPDRLLKHIAVGHGIQNYTCTAVGTKGVSAGALAVLHDITNLYPGSGPAALSPESWDTLTSKVLRTTSQPILAPGDAGSSPFPPAADLTVDGISTPLPFLGHHFFDGSSAPTFSLLNDAEHFKGQKVLGIPAPATADQGLTNEGAVDWLYLDDTGSSVGVTQVYRVLTSGGNPAVCSAVGDTQSVPYTTMYWFY